MAPATEPQGVELLGPNILFLKKKKFGKLYAREIVPQISDP